MVGIIILDYNNAYDTMNCISSVMEHTPNGVYKIMVVENGSNDATLAQMTDFVNGQNEGRVYREKGAVPKNLPKLSLLISQTNDGYAEGNNKALRLFEKDKSIDKILILNNDILFVEDIISSLEQTMMQIPDCGVISPLLVKKDGVSIDYNCARHDYKKMQFFWEYLFSFKNLFGIIERFEYQKKYLLNNPSLLSEPFFEIELPSGSCMMIDKDLFKSIGYFDNHTFLYFEENILYRKLLCIGRKNFIVPSLKCIHLGASTSQKVPSMFTMKCQMKSTSYYLKTYRDAPLLARYVSLMSIFTIIKIWLQGKFRNMETNLNNLNNSVHEYE